MLKVLDKIVEVDKVTKIDQKWQSDLYCHSYANNTRDKMQAKNKHDTTRKLFELKSSLSDQENSIFSNVDKPNDATVRSYEKDKFGLKKDILDETGFYVFDMENDDFLWKIDRIKDHLKKSDHPLNIFMKKFDDEFFACY
jgi:hypothetical protein